MQETALSRCYFHILHYNSGAKHENNIGKVPAGPGCATCGEVGDQSNVVGSSGHRRCDLDLKLHF